MSNKDLVIIKRRYQDEAKQKAAQSERWQTFFNLALMEKIEPWEIISFVYDKGSGIDLLQKTFYFARVAKILAAIDNTDQNKALHTTYDLINWNRRAIGAMIEVARQHKEEKSIKRGEKALEIINILFPEFLLEE